MLQRCDAFFLPSLSQLFRMRPGLVGCSARVCRRVCRGCPSIWASDLITSKVCWLKDGARPADHSFFTPLGSPRASRYRQVFSQSSLWLPVYPCLIFYPFIGEIVQWCCRRNVTHLPFASLASLFMSRGCKVSSHDFLWLSVRLCLRLLHFKGEIVV